MKKAFSRVLEHIELAPFSEEQKVIVVHTDNEKGASELAKLIEDKTGVKPQITVMGPVIGSHVGPNSVSCCWLSTKTRKDLLAKL